MGTFTIPGNEPRKILYDLWKNSQTKRTIGLQSGATLRVQTTTDAGVENADWTKNLDIDKYAHGAVVSLVNGSGGSLSLIEIGLKGRPVTISEGDAGLIHDSHADYESIYRDGESLIEAGSDYIVDITQLKEIADYIWKITRSGKHRITLMLPGTRYDFRPATRHRMKIGAAGETEYIDSTVEVLSVETDRSWKSGGVTRIAFREVEENWKYSSNAIARSIAASIAIGSKTDSPTIIVGSKHFIGPAHHYCTGTNDHLVIQKAIDSLVETHGGGIIHLTRGLFFTAGAINVKSKIVLEGEGKETIIEKTGDFYALSLIPAAADLENITIQSLQITRSVDDTSSTKVLIYGEDSNFVTLRDVLIKDAYGDGVTLGVSVTTQCDDITLDNVVVETFQDDGILVYGDRVKFINCVVSDDGTRRTAIDKIGIGYNGKNGSAIGCVVRDLSGTQNVVGIASASVGFNIIGCTVRDLDTNSANGVRNAIGIVAQGDQITIEANTIDTIENSGTSSNGIGITCGVTAPEGIRISNNSVINNSGKGILIGSGSLNTVVLGNYCADNGSDVGTDNANEDNFDDNGTNTFAG